ncbi:hypothetical protein [Pseudooceanicola aestuarii]|uniref:hypothetical protein n=1 Tax=Pseudooceanicola aestuarii TaxID=2697319 RepID=UPI0013D7061C|nr:hypothetical protein [Pseudooceanicola aestuarii]
MSVQEALAKPAWRALIVQPGFADISGPAILTTDSFFDFILKFEILSPTVGDIENWLGEFPDPERAMRLDHLQEVFAVFQPAFLSSIRQALHPKPNVPLSKPIHATSASSQSNSKMRPNTTPPVHEMEDWDPIAPPSRRPPLPRRVTIRPHELPLDYQQELRRAAEGLPSRNASVQVPARSMVKRMREKLCGHAWSAQRHGMGKELSVEGIDAYLTDLKERLAKKPYGLRWASMLAAADGLYLFARYSDAASNIVGHLKGYSREYGAREKGQKALKFFALLRTGNTTDRVLDLAENLLAGVSAEVCFKKRHQMRNAAAILGVFANAPLRNASAQLVFGENLFWKECEWVIRTKIRKTNMSRPVDYVLPLHEEVGRFVDAIVLGEASPAMLPFLRERLQKQKRQLFVLHDGTPAAATYVPRVFKTLTGNSFTTLRTMLYTDAFAAHGTAGIEYAKPAAHHSSTEIVKRHYIEEQVAELHATNLRQRRQDRQKDIADKHRDLKSALDDATDAT